MRKNLLIGALVVLSILGLADSGYLAEKALTGSQLTCSIKGLEGCNVVAQSAYSHFLGIPLGVYGLVFYGLMLVFVLLALYVPKRFVHDLLALVGIGGLIASIGFVLIQVYLIKAVCIYCLGSAAVALFACIASVLLWSHFRTTTKVAIPPNTVPPVPVT